MPLSWNEIKTRANTFSKEWQAESREDAEAKSFWDAFFNVFGITRRRIASFEEPAFGGRVVKSVNHPGSVIPARPFLSITPGGEQKILSHTSQYLQNLID